MSRLHDVGRLEGDTQGALVCVHGLGRHHVETCDTQNAEGAFWPNWLPKDLPGLAVYSLEYPAAASTWSGSAMPLTDRGTNLST